MESPTRYEFAGGTVADVWEAGKTVRVTLPDGSVVWGVPHLEDSYLQKALAAGYGDWEDPKWGLCREHELTHCWLAEMRDLSESPVLRAVADQQALEHFGEDRSRVPEWQWREEGEVMAWQRFVNSGNHNDDPGGILSAMRDEFGAIYEHREAFLYRFRLTGQPKG